MLPSFEEMKEALIKCHGREAYDKMANAKVAVCGLGGLGSNVAISLARVGVGHLHLMDFDVVDISNLHRQQYFANQIGKPKADAIKEILQKISPYGEYNAEKICIDENNIYDLLKDDEIIVEAFDDPSNKAMLVNEVLEKFPDKYIVSGSGMAGIGSANLIKTRKFGSRLYICGDEVSDVANEGSLFSSRVMTCAAHEANMVIRLILGETNP